MEANETILYIDLKKLESNFQYFNNLIKSKTKIIAVVKAFGYGHGDVEISRKLESLGIYALWVSDFEEGVELREAGIKCKIIIANPGTKSYKTILKYKLDVVVYSKKILNLYCNNKNPIDIHLKINTGMNRYGFDEKDIDEIYSIIKKNKHLNLLSICSHLASSERNDARKLNLLQLKKFSSINSKFNKKCEKKISFHILNSHGLLNYPEYKYDFVRIGIGLYGSANDINLKQISKLISVVSQIREIEKGSSVGYGSSYIAEKKIKMAIIPIGYADGLNRKLGCNNGMVLIKNKKCKIIGEISMDSLAVNISDLNVKEGDKVEVFGENLLVSEIASKINTIPYEIYSTLNRRIKRVYLN